ncbi:MAG: HD domain-containing protein [Bacteroidota bacterium]
MKNQPSPIKEIKQLFLKRGNDEYFGEKVSQYAHAAQTCLLAKNQGYDIEMQVAAFLHDIGHLLDPDSSDELMENYGRKNHEELAARWLLNRGFSIKIAEMIRNHVNAKRYLTYIDSNYYYQLSVASKKTLDFQGGIMKEEEAKAFEMNPFFSQIIRMRRWDDAAKLENLELPELDYFIKICESLLIENFQSNR